MKKILVLVDCQNDFIDGSLGVGHDKWSIAWKNIEKELKKEWDCIVFTSDCHAEQHCSFKENGGIWPKHCVAGTNGAVFYWKLLDVFDNLYFDRSKKILHLEKGKDTRKEEYGIDICKMYLAYLAGYPADCYEDHKEFYDSLEIEDGEQFEFYFCGIAYDYCVAECARMTAENNNCKCYIIKNGTVAINEDTIPEIGKAVII